MGVISISRLVGATAVCAALAVGLGACGSTSHSTSPPTTASPPAKAPAPPAAVDYGAEYLAIVNPVDAAGNRTQEALAKLTGNTTVAAMAAAVAPYDAALTKGDAQLARVAWPANVEGPMQTMIRDDGAVRFLFETVGDQTTFSLTNWSLQLSSAVGNAQGDAQIVRGLLNE
jgi:hypothetical protein